MESFISASRKSLILDDAEIINANNSKGVSIQEITCAGGGQYSVWDFVSIVILKSMNKDSLFIGWIGHISFNL